MSEKKSNLAELKMDIRAAKSDGLRRFNELSTSIVRGVFADSLDAVRINGDCEISVRAPGSSFGKIEFYDERAAIAVISAAVMMKLYRPKFPFIAFDDLRLDLMMSDRLACALSRHIEHVIYTRAESSAQDVKIVRPSGQRSPRDA